MQIPTSVAMLFIATSALLTGAIAQNIYKCGDAYSQLPCTGGVAVNAADQRTSEQKSQTDLATYRAAQTAKIMEAERLQQEKIDLAANTPSARPAGADKASKRQANPGKKKVQKKKKTSKRIADKEKEASRS